MFRIRYFRDEEEKERDECASLEGTVSDGMNVEDHLPRNDNIEYENELSFGEHLADAIAGFAGQLDIPRGVCRYNCPVGRAEYPHPVVKAVRSISVYPAQSCPFNTCRSPGPRDHHEPEPPGDERPAPCRPRLPGEHPYGPRNSRLHSKIDHLMTNQGQKLLEIQNIQL